MYNLFFFFVKEQNQRECFDCKQCFILRKGDKMEKCS